MNLLLIAGFAESLIGFRKPLIMALLDKGLIVHVAAPELTSNNKVLSELNSLGVISHDISMARTGTNPFSDLCTLLSLLNLIRKIKPECVLGYTIKPVIYGLLAASLAKVPKRFALITGLGYAFTGSAQGLRGIIRRIVQGLYRVGLSKADVVFFQNPDDELLFKQLGITSNTTQTRIVNGSGVDTSQYVVTTLPEQPNFLLIARLLGDKGVREYAEAARLVKQKYPEVRFDLVGWIDENPDAISQEELDAWISEEVINFRGKLSDVRPAIAENSVYVLPSYREGTPRTVLEAMAMGRAVITTDAPGCRETVVDGDNGFLVPVKDSKALAAAMLKFIEQPEQIVSMGKRSRKIAEEKYDVHKVNMQMLKGMGLI